MTDMIKFLDLKKVTESHAPEINAAIARTVESGWYLQGNETDGFEKEYAAFIGCRHAIGCANGLDALTLILRAYIEMGVLKPGDEVIVPANTYIASILAVTENGLVPVPVEPDPATCQISPHAIRKAISPRTRALMIVHLYGTCAYSEEIASICREYGIRLIEDNAQAHGCIFPGNGKRTGSLGDAAGHSFYPGKNLGALGDAGAVTTDDPELEKTVRSIANYGSSRKYIFRYKGRNSRIDEIQAAVLRAKLPTLDDDNSRRIRIAERYMAGISNPFVRVPRRSLAGDDVFHVFTVFTPFRDDLQKYLADNGVQTLIHYPVPPHRQECFPEWHRLSFPITETIHREELSLPISPVMTEEEAEEVIRLINGWTPSPRQ